MNRIKELQQALSISDKALEARRKKFRMKGGDVDAALLRWLEATWAEMRDVPRLLRPALPRIKFGPEPKPLDAEELKRAAEESAYTSNGYQSMRNEPEAIPQHVQEDYSRGAWQTFDVLKGEELAKQQARSRAERLRQYEMELRQQGKSPAKHLAVIEQALEAMRDEAKTT